MQVIIIVSKKKHQLKNNKIINVKHFKTKTNKTVQLNCHIFFGNKCNNKSMVLKNKQWRWQCNVHGVEKGTWHPTQYFNGLTPCRQADLQGKSITF